MAIRKLNRLALTPDVCADPKQLADTLNRHLAQVGAIVDLLTNAANDAGGRAPRFALRARPEASLEWAGRVAWVTPPDAAEQLQGCRQKVDGSFEWIVLAG